MKSKRLLTVLLVLCMLVSVLSPAASAVQANGSAQLGSFVETNKADASEDSLAVSENRVPHTMRGNGYEVAVADGKGGWTAEVSDTEPSVSLTDTELTSTMAELREAAAVYGSNDTVVAFVVMDEAPLAERYSSVQQVDRSEQEALLRAQNSVISKIATRGASVKVRYQFTYLTNAFSVETAFGNLEKIAQLDGVKSVYLMPVYSPATETVSPNTASSGAMTGVTTAWELDYTGEGMKIAIIDTGLDLDHPSFGALSEETVAGSEDYMTADDIAAVLPLLNAYAKNNTISAGKLYRSTKIPYAFNYVDNNLTADHSADSQGDHGTHVAGIAAANATEGTNVVGMAPDAQLLVMKVFGSSGGAYMDDIVAAMEDSMTLDCDVINASLGSPAGFSSENREQDLIFERLAAQDIIATVSAGNEGTSAMENLWGTDLNRTQNPDNGAVGSPSTFANALSIASAGNAIVMNHYFTLADGTRVFYSDPYQYINAMTDLVAWGYEDLEYVLIDGVGEYEDFYDEEYNSLVEGKIAVIKRGEISFGTKILNAEYAGAVAAIVWDNVSEDVFNFGMQISDDGETYPSIPACLISLEDGQLLADAESKTVTVSAEVGERVAEGGQMSSFSSWGVSPDLRLVPDVTGIGGNVYSCYDGGGYGLMSGTSMSAPQVAGVSALLLQYLKERYPNAPDGSLRDLAEAILMSTADPIVDTESEIEASPRQQGAGLINAAQAVTTEGYLTVGGERPKAELGDSADGTYSFSFELHNFSEAAQTYSLSSVLMTEAYTEIDGEKFMAGYNCALSGTVSFDKASVTVPAGGVANVNVKITLSDADKAMFAEHWENGGYVEGFVYLTNEDGTDLNLPFLGFYGDWTQAPVFDTAYWYGNSFWGVGDGTVEGDESYNILWTSLGSSEWVLGFNPYSGAAYDENNNIIYDPSNNTVSPNGDGIIDGLSDIYLSLLRNVKTLTLTYTVGGEIVNREVISNARKTMYTSGYGQVVPWLHSMYTNVGMYDFTDADGSVLPDGTDVLLTITAEVDYANGGEHSVSFPITVDNTAPELLSLTEVVEDGKCYLQIEASDNEAFASVNLLNPAGTKIYKQEFDSSCELSEDGTYVAKIDVTGLGTKLLLVLGDYAGNESSYSVTYTSAGNNLPEMDTDALYAYRLFDNYIYSDHMYGWVSLNQVTADDAYAQITVLTDDYQEFSSINAAEYAGGKIFAVDAVNNFVVMDPGLWNREIICNLGVNVLDMTFDDGTDTMYVLAEQMDETYLYALDVMTGELTELCYYGYYYYAPWALTDDDNGTLYAVMGESSYLYTLNAETYEATAVADADGVEVTILNSYGEPVAASHYSQSIAYVNGTIYWAYYQSGYMGEVSELIAISTADWTSYAVPYQAQAYDTTDTLVEYYPNTELVGLMTLTETEWQVPVAEEAIGIVLDATETIVNIGASQALTVSPLPWNYELGEVVWSSSDEAVVTVKDGVITGISEGSATVTASYGELSASCEVTVVDISGSFYAYNYYSADGNYGTMIEVDMKTMVYEALAKSPVDFLAGDYNGHDGCFYGYDQGGQLYRYDLSTGDIAAIGASAGTYPADMAYDYSTGIMYALVFNYSTYENTLYAVNMNNGKLLELAIGSGLMTLACDMSGKLYSVDTLGSVNLLSIVDYSEYGMGMVLEPMPILEGSKDLYMQQSICWDYENDVLLWSCCEDGTVYWIDILADVPYVVDLGDPTYSGGLEFVGMFTLPESIPELADVAVESVTAEDMLVLTGYEKTPNVTVAPFNATSQTLTLTSSDESIVTVSEAGNIYGVSAGTAEVTAALTDSVSGETFETAFTVTVMDGAQNLYGHLMTDLASYDGQIWVKLNPGEPSSYAPVAPFTYTLFTNEYYNGKIYTYAYDANDWQANKNFFVLDAETFAVETQIDMGDGFLSVYDMTYDYATSTMYAIAGPGEDDVNLYIVDMTTGELLLLMELEQNFQSLAAGPGGVLYAMEKSGEEMDWMTWQTIYTNTNLYAIDPLTQTATLIGDTGMQSNMIASMTYDYDTDVMYWTPFLNGAGYVSSLSIVDLETGVATSLGMIGAAGAQVGGLYTVSENFPEEDADTLQSLLLNPSKLTVTAGQTAAVTTVTIPMGLDTEITWLSSNESVATVENGVITGVSQGKATIVAMAEVGGVIKTALCSVAVLDTDASFLTYNVTDGGWAEINRADSTLVTNLTEGETLGVSAFTAVGTDIYGYDANAQLFKLNTETYERTPIGESLVADEGYAYEVRDMAYDAANERALILLATLAYDPGWGEYSEIYGGCQLYTVDLETGELTELYTFEEVYVKAITVDSEGSVYSYNTFDDSILRINPDTAESSGVITLQSQSIYGDSYCTYSLHYDALTDMLYLLFTGNGNYYRLLTIDGITGALNEAGSVGETVEEGWSIMGDSFVGLSFPNEHYHDYAVTVVPPTFGEEGYIEFTCDCGDSYIGAVIEALDHLCAVYTDIPDDWSKEGICYVIENGLMNGVEPTRFAPNSKMTRAQLVTVLYRLAGAPEVTGSVPFADVAADAWYEDAVIWAYTNGIVKGVTDTAFKPDSEVTREQMVTFFARFAAFCGKDVTSSYDLSVFADSGSVSAYAAESMAWAVENGIISGVSETALAPLSTSTRAQVATVLMRYCENLGK